MIDTIVFRIGSGNHSGVLQKELFSPEFNTRDFKDLSETERKNGHTKAHLRKFILRIPKGTAYTPRVEVWEKLHLGDIKLSYEIRIEVSLAKLLFGNNLQELAETDLNQICTKIQESLDDVGVKLKRDAILSANISRMDVGKNFMLPNHIPPHEIIRTITKTETSKAYECAKEKYRERHSSDGSLVRIRSGSKETLFYDKVADMQKTKSKAIDKQGKDMERAFLETYNLQDVHILRYEYRLFTVQTLKSEINNFLKREYHTKILFSDVFNDALLKHILQKSWKNIYTKPANQTLFKTLDISLEAIITNTMKRGARTDASSVHSFNKGIRACSLTVLIKEMGADMVRQLCLDGWCSKTCGTRLTKHIKEAEQLLIDLPVSDAMSFVDTEMKTFNPLTLASFDKYRII